MKFPSKVVMLGFLPALLCLPALFAPNAGRVSAETAARAQAAPGLVDKLLSQRNLPANANRDQAIAPAPHAGALVQRNSPQERKMRDLTEARKRRSGCTIKGNVRKVGNRRVYHMPDSRNYEKMRMNPKRGDRWFCSEQEARDAGFMPAAR